MKSGRFLFTIVASLFLVFPAAQAGERYQFYTGTRSLGMGGVNANTVNDETSALTNPAGLGKIRDMIFTIVDPELHGALADTEIINLNNYSSALSPQGLLDALNQSKGKHFHLKYQMFPSIVGPNFGTGLFIKYQIDGQVDSTGTNFALHYVNDWAIPLAYDIRLFGGVLKLGFGGRLMNRSEVDQTLPASSTGLALSSLVSEGMGIAADAGLILTIPFAMLPSLAVSVHDVGGTNYNLREGMLNATANRPADTAQSVDVGLAVQPIVSNRVRMTWALEYKDALTPLDATQEDWLKRSHAGVELNFADFAFIRGGANQGYWTAGLEFSTEKFQLQFATYGEELGTPTARQEDRRWVGKFALRF